MREIGGDNNKDVCSTKGSREAVGQFQNRIPGRGSHQDRNNFGLGQDRLNKWDLNFDRMFGFVGGGIEAES